MVDVLTRLEKPGETGESEAEEEGAGKNRREEEMAHEQLLFGVEVRQGDGRTGGGSELLS